MSRGVELGSRNWDRHHLGPSDHPLTAQLVNAAWGNPLRDITGSLAFNSLTVLPSHDGTNGNPGNGSHNTTPQAFRAFSQVPNNRPISIFGVISLASTSQRGVCFGVTDTALNDTGFKIGVGNTAPDSNGNNIVGVRGGINWTQSGSAIGTGFHSIGLTTDGSSNVQWFLDGTRVSTGGTGATWNLSGGTLALVVMGHTPGSPVAPSAGVRVFFAAAWTLILTSADFAELHEDPFVIVR